MVQRLLLDRVDAESAGASIGIEPDFAVLDTAHETQAALTVVHLARARTHVALHATVVELVPVLRRVIHTRQACAPSEETQAGRRQSRVCSIPRTNASCAMSCRDTFDSTASLRLVRCRRRSSSRTRAISIRAASLQL